MKSLRIKLGLALMFVISLTTNAQTFPKTELGIKAVINSVEVELQFYNSSRYQTLKNFKNL